MKYVIDANVLITAHRHYYNYEIVPVFWEWLAQCVLKRDICSVYAVQSEIASGKDFIVEWAKAQESFFIEPDDLVQKNYSKIVNFVNKSNKKQTEKEIFMNGADPWVIAHAKTIGATVVTLETLQPTESKKIAIPNICKEFDIPYVNTFKMMKELQAQFK